MITLELIEKFGPDGYQDETGAEYFDDSFNTPFGKLGNLKVEKVDDQWVIKEAPGVCLFAKGFIQSLIKGYEDECTTVNASPFGWHSVNIEASNGYAIYQLYPDELRFSDRPEAEVKCFLATLTRQEWKNV
ncbi:MAG: hypothetical protein A4E20_11035 [Nitrospira sp. SG-bin2]|uniref:hypothetical protein n=1 Tax=Nitrospira cf. moscoviensis SBR1015 TaxID=96242 RepID=UPI000A0B759C|nr:hypothetical protein [Nitrospira cf. moscoviensis SBR1015]OQW34547.1 MAG: hypothetical protein A4E20_11035 [Nitrospira sp. SG-bin2]